MTFRSFGLENTDTKHIHLLYSFETGKLPITDSERRMPKVILLQRNMSNLVNCLNCIIDQTDLHSLYT